MTRRLFFALLLLIRTGFAQDGSEGLYKLESLQGNGTRQWQLTGSLDGIAVSKFGTVTLKDQKTGPGEVILKDDGTVEASWKHRLHISYDYQPNYYQERPWIERDPFSGPDTCPNHTEDAWEDDNYYPLIGGEQRNLPINDLVVEFDTEATGTWSEGVSMNLNCDSTCTVTVKYKPEDSEDLQTETFTAELNGVQVNANATGAPDMLEFDIDMTKTFLKELANQHLTGDKKVAAEDALRNGSDRYEANYPACPNPEDGTIGLSGEFIDKVVKSWNYEGTKFTCGPTDGDLQPKYEQYYLIDVPAAYGFYVQGDYGKVDGNQEVEFRYGSETYRTSIETGYAEAANLDYKDSADEIEADILTDGDVALTLQKDLTKVDVSPWAGPAGSWSSTPGVMYKRSPLDWPVSLTATRVLSNASILTGLWGISGSASSTFDVSAHSEGTPQSGNLTANIKFKVVEKQLDFSLNGQHDTTLDGSGLTATGDFTTSEIGETWRKEASILSLVPGAGAVIASLGKLGTRLSAGAGASVEASLSGSLSGDYMATPSDNDPRFTSGTLDLKAKLTAQVNPVPKFARGVLNLDISGGGGADMVINLAPNPSVVSLTGHLNFSLIAKFFSYETEVEKEWTFGDPPAVPAPANERFFMLRAASAELTRSSPSNPLIELPAQSQAEIAHGPYGRNNDLIVYAEPHPSLPAPASRIVARYPDTVYTGGTPTEEWLTRTTAETGEYNFAPVFARPATTPSSEPFGNFLRGVAVWAQANGTAPADPSEFAAYMDSTELRFQYYNTSSYQGGFNPTVRELTSNTTADIGPSLVQGENDSQARLFWVRTSGTDLTGAVTPIQILTRNWISYEPGAAANDPSTAWSPEVVAVSGLAEIIDWRATAWDQQNAAIVLVVDTDGDPNTLDDSEIYLARETAGVWAAPVRLTTNAVADEAPTLLFKDATTLALGWRQGDTIVGTFDYDTTPTPSLWFDAASEVAPSWADATLLYRSSEDSLVVVWKKDQGLGFTEQVYGLPAVGSAWPAPRYHSFDCGVVSSFKASFDLNNDPNELSCLITAITEDSTAADLNTVPSPLPAKIQRTTLSFGPPARQTRIVEVITSNPNPQSGDDLRLAVRAESPSMLTYSWTKDGEPLTHFTGPELHLFDLSEDDEGTYLISIYDGTSITEHRFTVTLPVTYYTWIASHVPGGGPNLGPEDDLDLDGCKNALEYLFDTDPTDPTDCPAGSLTQSAFALTGDMIFDLNARATDIGYVIEWTEDFVTWEDVTSIFSANPVANGQTIRHFFTPFSPASFNSYENYGQFPFATNTNGFYRLRITNGPPPPAP